MNSIVTELSKRKVVSKDLAYAIFEMSKITYALT